MGGVFLISEVRKSNITYNPRRVCAGIALTERIQMLSLGSLLHSFDWRLPEGVKRLELSDKFGFVLRKADTLVAVPAARLEQPELYL